MRQIILDTETTGLETSQGHKVIEIGAVEVIERRKTGNTLHFYLNPEREIDEAAVEVHGITADWLEDKPRFQERAEELLEFLKDAELVIHNAPFDVGFLDYEFANADYGDKAIENHCQVLDTLALARKMHPGQRNSLDALCDRYEIDRSQRISHSALLDAEILADVYLKMTGGQTTLLGESEELAPQSGQQQRQDIQIDPEQAARLNVTPVGTDDLSGHEKWLQLLRTESSAGAVWDRIPD